MENTSLTLLAVVGAGIIQETLKAINRRQDKKEREETAKQVQAELQRAAARVEEHVSNASKLVAQNSTNQAGALLGELQRNSQLSVVAFAEANNVNSKLMALNKRIDEVILDYNKKIG